MNESWISVNDRLPQYGTEVLVYSRVRNITCIAEREKTDANGEHWSGGIFGVIYWMPLPAPPTK